MSDRFTWLATPYDVSVVAEKLKKPWSEVENHLWDDWCNREVTLFYIPDGTFKKFQRGLYERAPKGTLVFQFWNDIWDRPIHWESVQARTWIQKSDTGDYEERRFRIDAVIDGETRYSSFRIPTAEFDDSYLGPDGFYRAILDDMVGFIDYRAKEERYGHRPTF